MANFSDNPSSKGSLGVQNILNHSSSSGAQQQQSSPSIGGPASRLSLSDTDLSPGGTQLGTHYGHQPHANARQFPFPGPSGSLPSPVGERPSPASVYQLPSLPGTRRILSPRLSRASSVCQPSPHSAEPLPPHPFIPSPAAQKRAFGGGSVGDVDGPPPPLAGAQPRPIIPPLGSSQRSLSQPSLVPRLLTQDQQPPILNPPSRPPSGQGDIQPRPTPTTAFPVQPSFPAAATAPPMSARPYTGPGHLTDSRPWGPEPVSAGGSLAHMARSHPAHEADGFLYVGPGGERIHVPIDRQKASLEANIKRERNAGASARFRQRKKERDRELMERAQSLEDDKRTLTHQIQDLSHQVQELTEHLEFYKNDRNRLRDVVANTPAIRDQAAGPPSPVPSLRRAESYADRSPIGQHHSMPQSTSQGYASSDTSSVERPARRRRTDANPPDFSPVSYGSAPAYPQGPSPSSGLPPLHIGPLQPPSPSSVTGPDRLPPFRPLVSPGGMPLESQSPKPGSQPYPSLTKTTPELGWATRPTVVPP